MSAIKYMASANSVVTSIWSNESGQTVPKSMVLKAKYDTDSDSYQFVAEGAPFFTVIGKDDASRLAEATIVEANDGTQFVKLEMEALQSVRQMKVIGRLFE